MISEVQAPLSSSPFTRPYFDIARCALSAAGGRHIQSHSAIRHWWWGRGCRPGVAAPEAVRRVKGAWGDYFFRPGASVQSVVGVIGSGPPA